ncbi:Uncharacterized protein OBRU01_18091 [Operophtera brumata]|uniref:Uncharacterized protein n=1 Tax=Operophtera brumata TaxID=104452 RepID=A0A0L7KZU9_OPEBR|nr:Uncharacterized protein OBRU01_18091 [Operophtera brumata]
MSQCAQLIKVSAVSAFSFTMIRVMNPHLFYQQQLEGSLLALHYFVCGLMVVTSVIGFLNSSIIMFRSTTLNTGKNITKWLLFDSLFETARVLYLFITEVLLHSVGTKNIVN